MVVRGKILIAYFAIRHILRDEMLAAKSRFQINLPFGFLHKVGERFLTIFY